MYLSEGTPGHDFCWFRPVVGKGTGLLTLSVGVRQAHSKRATNRAQVERRFHPWVGSE